MMIHTVTLNPAVDKLLYLHDFKKNATNRVQSSNNTIGGKGTHVSINLKLLGLDNNAYGIVHGNTGANIIQFLKQYGVTVKFLHKKSSNAESRTNFLLIEDNGDCSILASKGIFLKNSDIESVIQNLEQNVHDKDFLILSGDARNCPDPNVYNTIIKRLKHKKTKVFLDTSGPTLKQCITESPYLIKPNLDELSSLCDFNLDSDNKIIEAIESLSIYNIKIIAVSLGGDGSIVKTPEGIYRISPLKVNVKNTIGCGDSFLSGLIYGLYKDLPMKETLGIATAVSAATAESDSSVGFNIKRAKALNSQVKILKIK